MLAVGANLSPLHATDLPRPRVPQASHRRHKRAADTSRRSKEAHDKVWTTDVALYTEDAEAVSGMELLKEIAPRTARVGLLFNPATAVAPKLFISSIQAAASPLAVEVSAAPVHAKDEIEGVITAQARNPGGSLVVMPDAFFFNVPTRDLVIALAAGNGVPTIYFDRLFVESGGLIAYSADFSEELRQAAGYIDRILKGAKLTDLPIQQPIKYELVINLKAAKSLGLNVPDRLLAVADQVIE